MDAGRSVQVRRQFVQVGTRRVLLRHAGQGPAVLLVHQSPQNGRAMTPWIRRLAGSCAVFAPDTPGYGHSDPLPLVAPTIADYAAALAALLDTLQLPRVLLFGMHTGAAIATQLALDRPARVAGLVCDGLALFDDDERAALLATYLPPFEPGWDGAHLRWAFARLREQHFYFPWFDGTRAQRLHYPLPSAERVHAGVLDLLDAGDGYRLAYRASFQHAPTAALCTLQPPARLCWREADVLGPHAARLQALPEHAQALVLHGGEEELVRCTDAAFDAWAAQATATDSAAVVEAARAATRHVVELPGLTLAFLVDDAAGAGTPPADGPSATLCLRDIGQPAALPAGHVGHGLAMDWPGHGASGEGSTTPLTMPALVAGVCAALDRLRPWVNTDRLVLQAHGGACALAVELALALGPRCQGLCLHDPLPLDAAERARFLHGLPSLQPDNHGGALLAAWDWARHSRLFTPWAPADASAVRVVPAPSPHELQLQVRELLRAGPLHAALWQVSLGTALLPALQAWSGPLSVQAGAEPDLRRLARQLAETLGLPATGEATWVRARAPRGSVPGQPADPRGGAEA